MKSLVGARFWITAYIALALGFWLPGDYAGLRPLVPWCLGGILFFTCLKVSLGEVAAGLRDRAMLVQTAWMSALALVGLPLLAWLILLPLLPAWAPGALLVSLMPAGLSSIALADLYRGDRVRALFLVLATSLLAPLTVPLILALCGAGGRADAAAIASRALYILMLLGLPFLAAQAARGVLPAFVARHHHRWGRGSIFCLCALIFVSCGSERHSWEHLPLAALGLPLLAAGLASALFLACVLILERLLPQPQVTVFACAAIYMNNGLGIAFAVKFFPGDPAMLLPAVLMQVPMVGLTALYGLRALRRSAVA